jgi:mannitol/fructose-specific phosphotransferase system IIA component (Ntr-type)
LVSRGSWSPDGAPVDVFFVLLSPPDQANQHMKSLARIARPARHEEFVEGPRKCAEAQEVVDHIGRYEREYL